MRRELSYNENNWVSVVTPLQQQQTVYFVALMASLLAANGLFTWAYDGGSLSREEIQHFFTTGAGNSVRTGPWLKNYYHQDITWTGRIYAIRRRPESMRLEVLIKVLPDSLLYDTVVILEGNTAMDPSLQKGSWVTFSGRIFNGVDTMGVKEVQVLLAGPYNIRPMGDIPVNNPSSPP